MQKENCKNITFSLFKLVGFWAGVNGKDSKRFSLTQASVGRESA
jgi:hypothetical protein